MFHKTECVAMLLAGGQGSRLGVLTRSVAKPAVPFGGKYRMIDFPLSNCVNSGIDTVGVLTQYQPLELNDYIAGGVPWDLDRPGGGVHILPPYQRTAGADWYKGTANAIYQNIPFIERYDPVYVLVLSGDHIYKMDYAEMLQFHKKNGADCTIAVREVSLREASRFGIMNTKETGEIYEFEEKPKQPKSTKASMGVYIFTWEKLRAYLQRDEGVPSSHHDFGKDVIPAMLADGCRMMAYPFTGYWRDVGTVSSLWQANLDLLDPVVALDLLGEEGKIYSRVEPLPPHYAAPEADIVNSLVADGCKVAGSVGNSVLFAGAVIERGAVVEHAVVMPGAVVGADAGIHYAILAKDCIIGKGAKVGNPPAASNKPRITVIGQGVLVAPGAAVPAGTMAEAPVQKGDE